MSKKYYYAHNDQEGTERMTDVLDFSDYPFLNKYTTPVKKAEREIVGRDKEMQAILAAFQRPELCNVILLAPAGTGKTALVQGTMLHDKNRIYLEVDLSKMIADLKDPNEMADRLKQLFSEVGKWTKSNEQDIVLFMDEFHQVVQLSDAAVEALKPLLADSGTRGIRVIAATTYEEFRKYISPNQPLVERLQRISLKEPGEEMTVQILRGMAKRYGVENQFYDDSVFKLIYEYTNRYIPANSQPRKSILMLDSMVGWHRFNGRKMDAHLLADVLSEQEGVNVAFKVDATKIKQELDKHVLAQQYATLAIEQRLQICVADLNNKTKPMSTLLFTGSTGVGKLLSDDTLVPMLQNADGSSTAFKRHGDLAAGDVIFDREGKPTTVEATFPHDNVPMYRVTLTDGRALNAGDAHLWTVYSAKQRQNIHDGKGKVVEPFVMSTVEILNKGLFTKSNGRKHLKWYIPMNGAVEWPKINSLENVPPYLVGVFIGNGCMTSKTLTFSSEDVETVNRVATLLEARSIKKNANNYNWTFGLPKHIKTGKMKNYQTDMVFGEFENLYNTKSADRRIPPQYMHGSIEQRWELIRGLFDTDGSVSDDDRCRVTYLTFSRGLAEDIRTVLFSLGVSSTIGVYTREHDGRKMAEYVLHIKASFEDKRKFFKLSRKLAIIEKWAKKDNRKRVKKYDFVGIKSIEFLNRQHAQCIMVDNPEHLYQAGDFVVTHNTEMTKQLAKILFDDQRALLRFDMTEYANPDSLERFRDSLTTRVWEHPYSIILLDEIEKACSAVTRLLLQVLDDGRLSDRNGRETSFINSYIVLTTNAGHEIYKNIAQYNADDEGSGKELKKYDALIRRSLTGTTGDNRFPPELLGRVDAIIPFQPLSVETQKKIVRMKLSSLRDEILRKYGATLKVDTSVIDYLVLDNMNTDSDDGGARRIMSKLESELTTEVARYINRHPGLAVIIVKVEGETAYENKDRLESQARIVVGGR